MSRETCRLALQAKLEELLGSRNVYFQPPSNVTLEYPCIIYSYKSQNTTHADNITYCSYDTYDVTIITKSPLPETLMAGMESLPYSKFERDYVSDNLHHFLYQVSILDKC